MHFENLNQQNPGQRKLPIFNLNDSENGFLLGMSFLVLVINHLKQT